MKPELKKLLVLNLPYLLFVYLFAKCGQAYRLAAGVDASAKLLHLTDGISAAFANPLPSLHPFDLCVGVAGAVGVRLIVYSKGKNAKKYRKGEEYGSARWGTAKDIAPYIDPKFENNILLTQTERLTMTGRPKDPKTARNKNVLVIGGSGSGKTRFYVKPNLMTSRCCGRPPAATSRKISCCCGCPGPLEHSASGNGMCCSKIPKPTIHGNFAVNRPMTGFLPMRWS